MKSFEAFFKNNSSVMLLIDAANGKIADANQAALRFYGYSRSAIKNLTLADINLLPQYEVNKKKSKLRKKKTSTYFYKQKTAGNIIKDVQAFLSPVTLSSKKYNFAIIQDVTELKQKEEENNRFRNIAENAISFIGIANMNREVVYINRSMRTAFAIPDNAILSDYQIYDFYTPKGLKNFKTVAKNVMQSGYWRGENEMKSLDGRIYQVIQTIILIRDENGIPQYTSSTAIDITAQKINESELINMASRYKTLMSAANEGIHIIDKNMNVVEVNEAFCKMLGYQKEELLKMKVTDWDARWKSEATRKIFNKIMDSRLVFESLHRRKDGNVIAVEISATGVVIEGKKYIYAASREITRRKQMEAALRESEENLKKGELIGKIGYVKAYMETGEIEFSQGASKIYGLKGKKPDVALLKNMRLPEYNHELDAAEAELIKENKPFEKEFRIRRRNDGEIVDILTKFSYDKKKKVAFGTLQDISARKKTEEQLRNSEKKYRQLITELPIGIVVHGPGGEVIYHNQKALEMLGLSSDQLMGKTPFSSSWNVIHENGKEYPRETLPAIVAIRTKKTVKNKVMGVYQPLMKDRVWLIVTAIPETGPDGSLTQVIVTFHDVSEIYKKETEILRLNDELKELNRYLQGIRVEERNKLAIETHDKLGQKLVGLKFDADYISNNLPDNLEILKQKAGNMTAEIAQMLRDFSYIYNDVNPTLIEDLELQDALVNLAETYRKKWGLKITYSFAIDKHNPSNEIKWTIYKSIEGYLYNAVLFSRSTTAQITLSELKNRIKIHIRHNKRASEKSSESRTASIRLIELRERIQSAGGTVVIKNPTGKSVQIQLSIPLNGQLLKSGKK